MESAKFGDVIPQDVGDDPSTYLKDCSESIQARQDHLRSVLAGAVTSALATGDTGAADSRTLHDLARACEAAGLPAPPASGPATLEHQVAQLLPALECAELDVRRLERHERQREVWADLHERVQDFQRAIYEGRTHDAAWAYQALGKVLEDLQADAHAEPESASAHDGSGDADGAAPGPSLAASVAAEHASMKEQLHTALHHLVWGSLQFFAFAPGSAVLQCACGLGALAAWDAAQVSDLLPPLLGQLAQETLDYVVRPLLEHQPPLGLRVDVYDVPVDEQDPPTTAPYAFLTPISPDAEPEAPSAAAAAAGDEDAWGAALTVLVHYLRDYVFQNAGGALQEFMEAFWPQAARLCASVPPRAGGDGEEDSASIQRRIAMAKGVEQQLQEGGVLSQGGLAWGALSGALCAEERRVLLRFQLPFLDAARRACCGAAAWADDNLEHVEVVGQRLPVEDSRPESVSGSAGQDAPPPVLGWPPDAPVLGEGKYVVWRAASQLVGVLSECVLALRPDSIDLQANAACKTVADVACLYKALVIGGGRPLGSSRRCLVHANSAAHLARAALLLPVALGPALPCHRAVRAACLDAAAVLAASADGLRQQLVRKQGLKIRKLLQSAPHFCNLEAPAALAARRQVQQAVTSLRGCSEALAATCAARVHALLFAGVLASVCEHIEAKICSIKDIGEADSEEILRIVSPMWTDVPAAAAAHLVGGARGKRPDLPPSLPGLSVEQVAEMLQALCPPVRKLEVLGQLLTARLAAFVDGWQSGRLQQSGFSCKQICALVMALFEDNPYRRQCLQQIKAV